MIRKEKHVKTRAECEELYRMDIGEFIGGRHDEDLERLRLLDLDLELGIEDSDDEDSEEHEDDDE